MKWNGRLHRLSMKILLYQSRRLSVAFGPKPASLQVSSEISNIQSTTKHNLFDAVFPIKGILKAGNRLFNETEYAVLVISSISLIANFSPITSFTSSRVRSYISFILLNSSFSMVAFPSPFILRTLAKFSIFFAT